MSDIPRPANASQAPSKSQQLGDSLTAFVNQSARAIKSAELSKTVFFCGITLLGLLALAIVVDHWIWQLNTFARFLVWGSWIALFIGWIVLRIIPLSMRRIHPAYAAKQIEETIPELKNSLINWLQLSQESDGTPRGVIAAVGRHAAGRLNGQEAASLVDYATPIRMGAAFFGITVILIIYMMLSPKSGLDTVRRVLFPWSDIAAPSRSQIISVTPGDATVTLGTSLPIQVQVRGVREGEGVQILYDTADGQLVNQSVDMDSEITGLSYSLDFQRANGGIQQPFVYRIQAGDAVAGPFQIKVQSVPLVVVDRIEYVYPAYTQMKPRVVVGDGHVEAVEGTTIKLHATANQPMARSRIEFDPQVVNGQFKGASSVHDLETLEKEINGSWLLKLNENKSNPTLSQYRVRTTNQLGESNSEPVVYGIRVLADLAPEVRIDVEHPNPWVVAANATVPIAIRAVDPDFGLRQMQLKIEKRGLSVLDTSLMQSDVGQMGNVNQTFPFCPKDHGLKTGDTIQLVVEAKDNRHRPGTEEWEPNVTKSEVIEIEVGPPKSKEQLEAEKWSHPTKPPEKKEEKKRRQSSSEEGKSSDEEKGGEQEEDRASNEVGAKQDPNQKSGKKEDSKKQSNGKAGGQSTSSSSNKNSQEDDGEEGSDADSSPSTSTSKSKRNPSGKNAKPGEEKTQENQEMGEQQGDSPPEDSDQPQADDQTGESKNPQEGKSNASKANAKSMRKPQDGNAPTQEPSDSPEEGTEPANKRHDGELMEQLRQLMSQSKDDKGQQKANSKKNSDANSNSERGKQPDGQAEKNPSGAGESNEKPPGERKSDENQSGENQSGEKQPSDNKSSDNKSSDNKSGENKSGENKSGENKSGENKTGENKTGENKTGENKTGENKTGENKTGENKTGENKSGESKSGDNKSGENKSGENKSGENKSGENKSDEGDRKEKSEDGESGESSSGSDSMKGESSSEKKDGGEEKKQEDKGKGDKSQEKGSQPSQPQQGSGRQEQQGSGEQGSGEQGSGEQGSGEQGSGEQGSGEQGSGTEGDGSGGESGKESGKSGSKSSDGKKGSDGAKKNSNSQPSSDNSAKGSQVGGEKSSNANGSKSQKDSQGKQESPDGAKSEQAGDSSSNNGPPSSTGQGGNESAKGNDSSAASGKRPDGKIEEKSDAAELEYARKATDMVLDYLNRQRDQPDPEMLRKMGWSKSDLQAFLDRWQRAKEEANKDPNKKRELDESLRSLGLLPPSSKAKRVDEKDDFQTGMRENGSQYRPPEALRLRWNNFRKAQQKDKQSP